MSRALGSSCVAIAIPVSISVGSMAIYRLLGPSPFPNELWWSVLDILSSWSWIPLRFVLPIDIVLQHRFAIGFCCAVLLIALLPCAAVTFGRLKPIGEQLLYRTSPIVTPALLLSILILGVWAALTAIPFWSPLRPSGIPGFLTSSALLNGVFLHTGATSWAAHYLSMVVYATAVLAVAIPSVIWLGIPAFVMARNALSRPARLFALALVIGAVAYALAAAFMLVPFSNRYFNLSITAVAVALLLPLVSLVKSPMTTMRGGAAVCFFLVVAIVAEVLPFRPLYAAFRPFWAEYGDKDMAELGRLNPSWIGWGEDVMRAGKLIDASCEAGDARFNGVACSDIKFYSLHPGLWLPGSSKISYVPFDQLPKPAPLDERSFYVVNRSYLIQNVVPIPRIEPDFVISYRGYALGWVWRGDRLLKSGYRFGS